MSVKNTISSELRFWYVGTKAACVRILKSFGSVFFFLAPDRIFSESIFDLRLEKV